jgi:RNAse (barnase) inhibitor barstar
VFRHLRQIFTVCDDEENKTSFVTLWDCTTGNVKKRLKNESDVMAIGLTNNASRVIIGRGKDELHIWDPMIKILCMQI